MKYLVLIPDGMADEAIPELNNRTPMEVAQKPTTDALAKRSFVGTVSNVPSGMVPESDTANMAILSFDPKIYSKGRSPLEAMSLGISMSDDEVAIRCNLVSISDEEENYEDKVMLDHSSDEIATEEADVLVKYLEEKLGNEYRKLHTGISYRHCLIWKNCSDSYNFARPHDILGKRIGEYLPSGEEGKEFLRFMKESYALLKDHPINVERRKRGLRPANSAWLWSPGRKPSLPSFADKYSMDAAIVCAVDLIKGIGICADMKVINVPGATGNFHTNYKGKADGAIKAFNEGAKFVYVHVEAPDECGHQGDAKSKVRSIELIDSEILSPVYEYLKSTGEEFKIMILPDHPTPVKLRTHTIDPVPFMIYSSDEVTDGVSSFTEKACEDTGYYLSEGHKLLTLLIK